MFGPVTNRECIGWQLRAVRVLTDLLKAAHTDDLPVVAWSVGRTGNLVAHCYHGTATERRTAFEAWRALLGATAWPERTDAAGATHLHATVDRYSGVQIAVLADLFPDDDDQAPSHEAEAPEVTP